MSLINSSAVPLASETQPEVIGAPSEVTRRARVGNRIKEMLSRSTYTVVSTAEITADMGPAENIRLQHLPAAALPVAALALIAAQEQSAQEMRKTMRPARYS